MAQVKASNRILIVDDNAEIHRDFARIFATSETSTLDELEQELFGGPLRSHREPLRVDSALQGRDGLQKVVAARQTADPYFLAFVDMRMPPGWDGLETTGRILEADPCIQVVIVTAFSDYDWDQMTEALGENDRVLILKKPFDEVEVLQLARTQREKWRLTRESQLRMAELETIVEHRTSALAALNARLSVIIEASPIGIISVDALGTIKSWNPAVEVILGVSQSRAVGEPVKTICPPIHDVVARWLRYEGPHTLETEMRREDDTMVDVVISVARLMDEHGAASGLILSVCDVSERKKSEKERAAMEERLRQAQKLESIGQLAAGVAHEINTPLQYVGDNVDFLKYSFDGLRQLIDRYEEAVLRGARDRLGEHDIDALARAKQEVDFEYLREEVPHAIAHAAGGLATVSKIVVALKAFSHPDESDKAVCDLNGAIENTVIVCKNEWKHVAKVELDLEPTLPLVPCVVGEVNQVILNLIVNAAQAIGEVRSDGGGRIVVSSRHEDGFVVVRVQDDGPGIPESMRHRVFDPFFTTKPVGKGSGQGLALAHAVIAERHGGEIEFESTLGQGTTFVVRLPVSPNSE